MAEKKEYRSAIRSRKLIRQAFFELLKEKDFEKITVTDIVKKADVNRSTFYAHYPDVLGVIEEIQEEIIEYTQTSMNEMDFKDGLNNPMPHLKHIVKLVEENNELYRLLMTSAIGMKQMEKIKGILIDRTIETLKMPEEQISQKELEFTIRFFMSGIMALYTQWLNGEINCTLEELNDQLANLVQRSVKMYQ